MTLKIQSENCEIELGEKELRKSKRPKNFLDSWKEKKTHFRL